MAALASVAYWGSTIGSGIAPVIIAIAAPLVIAILWGSLAAPRAKRRLPVPVRVPFELTVFALAGVALAAASSTLAAIVFASAALVNAALLTMFGQWDA